MSVLFVSNCEEKSLFQVHHKFLPDVGVFVKIRKESMTHESHLKILHYR